MNGQRVVVAGGTGNVGTFIVQALLERGATVVVPSRSQQSIATLRAYLAPRVDNLSWKRLQTVYGDVAGPSDIPGLGDPDAVVASLGTFIPAASLLSAAGADLDKVLNDYVRAHFEVARRFLPGLIETRGTYIFINGPLAFETRPEWGAGLVSIATAAQHMLFRALAQELGPTGVRIAEVVNYAFIRERRTQPGSAVTAEAAGAFVADLIAHSEHDIHGQTIHADAAGALV